MTGATIATVRVAALLLLRLRLSSPSNAELQPANWREAVDGAALAALDGDAAEPVAQRIEGARSIAAGGRERERTKHQTSG
jgi:hypothetical protein